VTAHHPRWLPIAAAFSSPANGFFASNLFFQNYFIFFSFFLFLLFSFKFQRQWRNKNCA